MAVVLSGASGHPRVSGRTWGLKSGSGACFGVSKRSELVEGVRAGMGD